MSIETEILRLQNAKQAIKTSIENKGVQVAEDKTLEEYPVLIDDIQSGGSTLWAGGGNPVLLNSVEKNYNLANDTNYNSITPSTSSQEILAGPTLISTPYGSTDDSQYDYVAIVKTSVKLAYKNISSSLKYIKSKEYVDIWNLGQVYYTSIYSKSDTAYSLVDIDLTLYNNGASGEAFVNGYNPYGIFTSTNRTPYIQDGSSASNISIYGNPFSCVANNSYMALEAFDYLDAENSSITYKAELYQVDKGTAPYLIARNNAIDSMKNGSI